MTSSQAELPKDMHALRMIAKGPAESSLKYEEVPVPTLIHPTDVLVRIKAAGVNPIDTKLRAGNLAQVFTKVPSILGADFAGDVVSVGAKVTTFSVGDAVYGTLSSLFGPQGTYAEYVVVSTDKDAIEKKPENLSYVEAASVGIAGLSAYAGLLLDEKTRKTPQTVLVIGASGGVGTFAIKLAKAIGTQDIVGICSENNKPFVESLGATRVVNYGSQEELDALAGVQDQFDIVVDCVGSDSYYDRFIRSVKKSGIFCTLAGPGEHLGAQNVGFFDYIKIGMTLTSRRCFGPRPYRMVLGLPHAKFGGLHRYIEKGDVGCKVDEKQVFDLKDGVKAHQLIETHHAVGKVVLRTGEQ